MSAMWRCRCGEPGFIVEGRVYCRACYQRKHGLASWQMKRLAVLLFCARNDMVPQFFEQLRRKEARS